MRMRLIRLRFRRRLRKSQQQVEELGTQAEQGIERLFFRRFSRLKNVRRFVIGWLSLVILIIGGLIAQNYFLSGYYQTLEPVPGGIYNEGIVGRFTTANPLFAASDVDSSVSRLLFASLLTYNNSNKLVGDLASYYSVNDKGTVFTVHLKPHLTWQDGKPLTSADVLYTYQMIQDPDTQSPLQNSFQGVTVTAPNARTVVFTLPDPLASFPESLTNGIIPEHLLHSIPPVDLRSADFNTVNPVGSGPFAWQAIQVTGSDPNTAEEQIALTPFANYQGGKPKLDQFDFHVYATNQQMTSAFQANELNGAEGFDEVPAELKSMDSMQTHNLILTAANMVFFKTSTGVLADSVVRHALVESANIPAIINNLGYPTIPVREPFLMGQLGFAPTLKQDGFNLKSAKSLLTSDGWVSGHDGIRTKNGQRLEFNLTAADIPEDHMVVSMLQHDWQRVGVQVDPTFLSSLDFQNALADHEYDSVLNGISIGIDPDVFVYWDSAEADIRSPERLNLSEYNSPAADASLQAGRTRLMPALRAIKYQPFLQAWQQDNPALGLYQPRLLYITDGNVAGLNLQSINTSADRFNNVQNWEIRIAKVTD